MASAAGAGEIVTGRVDSAGRLVSADPLLADLQEQAGASIGERLALPQLAAVARHVRKLGIAIARPALVAGRDHDLELWVRGEPDGSDVLLSIESWRRKPASGPRLELAARSDDVIPSDRGEWATDSELRVSELSGDLAELLGIGNGEAAGQPLTRWVKLEEGEDGNLPMLQAVAARAAFAGQQAVSRANPAHKIVLSGAPVTGADGRFAGFRGSAQPVERPSREAANERGNANLAIDPALDHALRSPLDRIIRAAEGIADRSEGPLRSDYAAYAADIAAAAQHLLSVIRMMVDQPPGSEESVDMVALADEAIGLVETQAEEKTVSIERDGIGTLHSIGEDRSIVQILVNLLANAVRHSPPGSKITVSLAAGTDYASVTVSDEGKGIVPEDQQRIFERFERGEEGGGGSGLGLAIARRLARTMGGDITLVSTPGEGARFTLSLPLDQRLSTGT